MQAALEDYKKQLAKAENTPIKAENKKVRMVPIKIEKTKSERDDVFVCVNGKNFQIKRGEIVNVPEYVCEVLENMKKWMSLRLREWKKQLKILPRTEGIRSSSVSSFKERSYDGK